MIEPLDPSLFVATIQRDAMWAARIRFWLPVLVGTVLTLAVLVVIAGAAVGVGKWLAGI